MAGGEVVGVAVTEGAVAAVVVGAGRVVTGAPVVRSRVVLVVVLVLDELVLVLVAVVVVVAGGTSAAGSIAPPAMKAAKPAPMAAPDAFRLARRAHPTPPFQSPHAPTPMTTTARRTKNPPMTSTAPLLNFPPPGCSQKVASYTAVEEPDEQG